MQTFSIKTQERNQMLEITHIINEALEDYSGQDGFVIVYVPHTTAGVTINENADPDVVHDMLLTLEELVPHRRRGYRHAEGNSDSHVKASCFGFSDHILFQDGRLVLGTWQGVYFCEFDGPRTRNFHLQIHTQS